MYPTLWLVMSETDEMHSSLCNEVHIINYCSLSKGRIRVFSHEAWLGSRWTSLGSTSYALGLARFEWGYCLVMFLFVAGLCLLLNGDEIVWGDGEFMMCIFSGRKLYTWWRLEIRFLFVRIFILVEIIVFSMWERVKVILWLVFFFLKKRPHEGEILGLRAFFFVFFLLQGPLFILTN